MDSPFALTLVANFEHNLCLLDHRHTHIYCLPSESDIQISASEGLSVRPATLVVVDMVNVKHSSPGSSTSSDMISMGAHWIKASSLNVKMSSIAVKSSSAEQK